MIICNGVRKKRSDRTAFSWPFLEGGPAQVAEFQATKLILNFPSSITGMLCIQMYTDVYRFCEQKKTSWITTFLQVWAWPMAKGQRRPVGCREDLFRSTKKPLRSWETKKLQCPNKWNMNINYTNFFMESLPTLFRFIDACPIVDTVVFQSGVLIVFNEIGTLSHHLQGLIHLR